MEHHRLEWWQRGCHLECMLLVKGARTVDNSSSLNFVFIFTRAAVWELDLGWLAHIDTNLVEVTDFLTDDLGHVYVRLWDFPSIEFSGSFSIRGVYSSSLTFVWLTTIVETLIEGWCSSALILTFVVSSHFVLYSDLGLHFWIRGLLFVKVYNGILLSFFSATIIT